MASFDLSHSLRGSHHGSSSSQDWREGNSYVSVSVPRNVTDGAENNPTAGGEPSTEYQKASDPNLPSKKRGRSENSRTSMSYPRKRAVTACQLCRIRKTKCSNTRPKCQFCLDAGADCVYEDPLGHSSFDPASLLILERLNQLLERIDGSFAFSSPQQFAPPPVLTLQRQLSSTSPGTQSSYGYDSGQLDPSDEAYMKIPSSRTTCDSILLWPIFDRRYPSDFLLQPLLEAGCRSESYIETEHGASNHFQRSSAGNGLSSGALEDNVFRLIENFIVLVHTKNPILDIHTLKRYAREVAEDGLAWDAKSCLILLACALGSIAKPFADSVEESPQLALHDSIDSVMFAQHDLKSGEYYYGLARKRIGLLGSTIIRAQCFLLSGVYLMYTLRPLEVGFDGWSRTFRRRAEQEDWNNVFTELVSNLNGRLLLSKVVTYLIPDSEIRVELALPESSITNLRYPDMFPSPPVEQNTEDIATVTDGNSYSSLASPSSASDALAFRRQRAESIDGNQRQSWYYYLTEIALRRIGNRILNALYKNKNNEVPGFQIPVIEMLQIAVDFEKQLIEWQANLPESLSFDHENLSSVPTNELTYMVRSRTIDIKSWLYRPFLFYAIHHPADDPYRQLVQPFVVKALQHACAHIHEVGVRHRHHGTWYGARSATAAAFSIIAAVKCGHVEVFETWRENILAHIGVLKFWEAESPDLAKARVVLQEMVEEVS